MYCMVQYICVVAFGPTTTPVVKQYTSDPPCLGLQSTINLQICSKTFVIPPPKKDLGIANKFTVNPTTSREESILFDHIMNLFLFYFFLQNTLGTIICPLLLNFFAIFSWQDNSSDPSPDSSPDEFGEHLTRDQRQFLHKESLLIVQIPRSMLALLLFSWA